jgi:uncharacterized membrane protein YedE/YeeE
MVFGLGLVVSQMADPRVVLSFLTVDVGWNPALILVMGSAVTVTFIGYRLIVARGKPLYAARFRMPERGDVDKRLVAGATLFGVGWGITGYCPGPALVGAFALDSRALVFVAAFIVGIAMFEMLERVRGRAVVTAADG